MRKIALVLTFLCNVIIALANVDSVLSVEKMEVINGIKKYQKADNVNPGDTLIYTLTVTNNTKEIVKNITPSIPIPEYTVLEKSMIAPNNYMVSINNKNYTKYPYIGADGRPVADSMYKSIRWTVDTMKPNEVKVFKFGAKVN